MYVLGALGGSGVDPNLMKNAHAIDVLSPGYHRFCFVMVEFDVHDQWIWHLLLMLAVQQAHCQNLFCLPPLDIGWLPIRFRNLDYFSKLMCRHAIFQMGHNLSKLNSACHWTPSSRFWSRPPLLVLNHLNKPFFIVRWSIPEHHVQIR